MNGETLVISRTDHLAHLLANMQVIVARLSARAVCKARSEVRA